MLDGDPTFADFEKAVRGFKQALKKAAVAAKVPVEWELEDLIKASAGLTVRAKSSDPVRSKVACDHVLSKARQAKQGEYRGGSGMKTMASIIGERVPWVRIETASDDVTLTEPAGPTPDRSPIEIIEYAPAFGAVEGRVQTLSNRGSLHFIVYDLLFDKAISCYLEEGQEETMRDVWGQMAVVEGIVKRDPRSGRPLTIRRIRNVQPQRSVDSDAWRAAEGVLRSVANEPAEQTIRRIRDAG